MSGDFAYLAAGDLVVVDVADPRNPHVVSSVPTGDTAWKVTVAGSRAYVVAMGTLEGGFLQVIDIADPLHPYVLGTVDVPGLTEKVAVAGGFAYVAS